MPGAVQGGAKATQKGGAKQVKRNGPAKGQAKKAQQKDAFQIDDLVKSVADIKTADQTIKAAVVPKAEEAAVAVDNSVGSVIARLTETITPSGKSGGAARLEAMKEIDAIATGEHSDEAEPFLVNIYLPVLFSKITDKDNTVAKAAPAMISNIIGHVKPAASFAVIQQLFTQMEEEVKWKSKVAAIEAVSTIIMKNPDEVGCYLPAIIPVITGLLHDIEDRVATAARSCMEKLCTIVGNSDLEPTTPALIKAMEDPSEGPECIHILASTTFVQTVEAGALAIIVPLMLRGFREKAANIKRMCCRIVANMAKLVDEPLYALPFVEDLIPAVKLAADTISDPEARDVAEASHTQLLQLQKKGLAMTAKGEPDACAALINEVLQLKPKTANQDIAIAYVAQLCSQLIKAKVVDVASWKTNVQAVLAAIAPEAADKAVEALVKFSGECQVEEEEEEEDDEAAEILCDCKFTLAYGTKVLLHNTNMKLRRGLNYGLLGGNDSGKTTLLRSIAQGQVEGFPDRSEVRTVFVEADIQGEISHLCCQDYILASPAIEAVGATAEDVRKVLLQVGFTEKMCVDPIDSLSGGWRMKLALARAMLQNADILLLDEPTNHLDVMNVAWVEQYLNSLTDVTSIIVSHDSGLLNNVCTNIIQIKNLKLNMFKGNLAAFVEVAPEVKSYFSFKASKLRFKFPPPSYLEGVKSRGKALMKMDNMTFTYPSNDIPTITNATLRVSMSSRVACLGPNGAGKSTLIKVLTGEMEPGTGTVWQHSSVKVGYIAQHAFHHIESHLDKSPNEYIRWRYEHGEDKEGLAKETLKLTEEEEKLTKEKIQIKVGEEGKLQKRVVDHLAGGRKDGKSKKAEYLYEVRWMGMSTEANTYVKGSVLADYGFTKFMKIIDAKILAREGAYARPLTTANVEKHIGDVGLEAEFATHYRMRALSGGQKVKVVLAAAMWDCPHILILDEPTNYLDRESLGALASAIEEYEGGIVMITHNNDFCSQLCPETWTVEAGKVDCKGDAEWMKKALAQTTEYKMIEEMTDANGNVSKVKAQKKKGRSRKELKKLLRMRAMRLANGEEVSTDSELDQMD